jgi:hypothetical protein
MARQGIAALLLIALLAPTARAACPDSAGLAPGDRVTILKNDGVRMDAKFVRAEPAFWVLDRLPVYARRAPKRIELATADVARLELPSPKRLRVRTLVFSTLAGFTVGAALATLQSDPPGYAFVADAGAPYEYGPLFGYGGDRHIRRGAIFGSLVGTLVGVGIAPHRDPPRTFACDADSTGAR